MTLSACAPADKPNAVVDGEYQWLSPRDGYGIAGPLRGVSFYGIRHGATPTTEAPSAGGDRLTLAFAGDVHFERDAARLLTVPVPGAAARGGTAGENQQRRGRGDAALGHRLDPVRRRRAA